MHVPLDSANPDDYDVLLLPDIPAFNKKIIEVFGEKSGQRNVA